MLAYNQATDEAMWVSIQGMSSALMSAKQKLACELARITLAPMMASDHEKMETDMGSESSTDSNEWDMDEEEEAGEKPRGSPPRGRHGPGLGR